MNISILVAVVVLLAVGILLVAASGVGVGEGDPSDDPAWLGICGIICVVTGAFLVTNL